MSWIADAMTGRIGPDEIQRRVGEFRERMGLPPIPRDPLEDMKADVRRAIRECFPETAEELIRKVVDAPHLVVAPALGHPPARHATFTPYPPGGPTNG